ncbi:MAG: type II toxin-antitoxin system RelE/ParE family toxin [Verrucomicrobia bacterium]|nr:type II toxin-antitoxin system RelE/ParE family toxin [Verrucomicrobiota bacterium]
MRYEIVFSPEATEDWQRLRTVDRTAVREALERHLRHQPTQESKSRIKRLRGLKQPQYRLRVGEIRVFYDVRENTVEVLAVVSKPDAAAWLAEKGTVS